MTATALIECVKARGIELIPEGEHLRWRAPKGVLTDNLRIVLQQHKTEIIKLLGEDSGPGRPSPENTGRPVGERYAEALELLGELTYMYNERASILEYVGTLPRDEAESRAKEEVMRTETYRMWRALG